jgi:hypothetical protein
MKKIKLHLTGCGTVLTEAAEKKLETGEDYQIPTCSNGKTSEFYDDIGIPLPEDLVEKLKKQDKGVELEDQDFEEIYSDVSIYAEDIILMVEDEGLTTLFVRNSDLKVTVLETVNQIDEYIEYMSLNSFQKAWMGLKISVFNLFLRKNKNITIEIE